VATNSGRLRGKIAAKGQGRYEGSLDSPQTAGPAVLAGHAENDKIVLSARFVDRFSKRPSKSTISLLVGDGSAYRLVSNTSNIPFKPDNGCGRAALAFLCSDARELGASTEPRKQSVDCLAPPGPAVD